MTKEEALNKLVDAESIQDRFKVLAESVDTFKPLSEIDQIPVTKDTVLVEAGVKPQEGKNLPSFSLEITFGALTFVVDGHRVDFPPEEACYILNAFDEAHLGLHQSLADIVLLLFDDLIQDPEVRKKLIGRILTNRN